MPEFNEQPELLDKHTPKPAQEQEAGPGHDHGLGLASTLGNAHVGRVLNSPGVQRAGATSAQQLDESVARAIEDRRGHGRPLDDDTRAEMEGSLGHDLSDVRVHTDSDAHQLNEAVSARAFATGNDVFFKQGTYDPGSLSGTELLGHELTHVVQQREGTSGLGAGEVSHPSDAAEQHAASMGSALANSSAGRTAARSGSAAAAAPAGVARDEEDLENEPGEPASPVSRKEEDEDTDEDAGMV